MKKIFFLILVSLISFIGFGQELIVNGDSGRVVLTKINGNFTELYEKDSDNMKVSEAFDLDSLLAVKLDSLATVLRAEMGVGITHDTINNQLIAESGTVIDTFYSDGTYAHVELYGPELVPTPDFSSSDGYDLSNGTTITGGECVANTTATYATLLSFNAASMSAANFQNGTTYRVSIDVTDYTSGTFRVRIGSTTVILDYDPVVQTYTAEITTTEVPTSVLIGVVSVGAVMKFDNFSIKEVL